MRVGREGPDRVPAVVPRSPSAFVLIPPLHFLSALSLLARSSQAHVNAFGRSLRTRVLQRTHVVHAVGRKYATRMGCDGKFFVGGNWKSNGTKASVAKLVEDLNAGTVPSNTEVVCAPTFVHLQYVNDSLDASKFQVSAQNCWVQGYGAYTGEITAEALGDMSVDWVILGHSERRALNGESNEFVADKCKKVRNPAPPTHGRARNRTDKRTPPRLSLIHDPSVPRSFRRRHCRPH